MMPEPDVFPPEVAQQLKHYVYRLIDPRNGETFYVGRGEGNRVFAHSRAEASLDTDPAGNKLSRIRAIRLAGLEVGHVIHRHGMDAATASEVEAALIDAYSGLTNIAAGAGSGDYGPMHASEILRRYAAAEAIFAHRALLINVSRSASEFDLYEATRCAWRLNVARARQADVVLATVQGLIVGAFVAHEWLEATAANFPGRGDESGRYGFIGSDAPHDVRQAYIGRRVPEKYRLRGAANPIKYTW